MRFTLARISVLSRLRSNFFCALRCCRLASLVGSVCVPMPSRRYLNPRQNSQVPSFSQLILRTKHSSQKLGTISKKCCKCTILAGRVLSYHMNSQQCEPRHSGRAKRTDAKQRAVKQSKAVHNMKCITVRQRSHGGMGAHCASTRLMAMLWRGSPARYFCR